MVSCGIRDELKQEAVLYKVKKRFLSLAVCCVANSCLCRWNLRRWVSTIGRLMWLHLGGIRVFIVHCTFSLTNNQTLFLNCSWFSCCRQIMTGCQQCRLRCPSGLPSLCIHCGLLAGRSLQSVGVMDPLGVFLLPYQCVLDKCQPHGVIQPSCLKGYCTVDVHKISCWRHRILRWCLEADFSQPH